jgi:hypothetical protein
VLSLQLPAQHLSVREGCVESSAACSTPRRGGELRRVILFIVYINALLLTHNTHVVLLGKKGKGLSWLGLSMGSRFGGTKSHAHGKALYPDHLGDGEKGPIGAQHLACQVCTHTGITGENTHWDGFGPAWILPGYG